MATYVILAGATAGGWYMKPVAERLRRKGHDVYTPTYTGLGERSHLLNPDIDLESHILDVLQVFKYEDLHDVILVGKSYSGMVITGIADRLPEKISHLVYLDAAVPENGQSLVDLLDSDTASMVAEVVKTHGEGWLFPADTSVDQRLTHHPSKTAYQSLLLQNEQAADKIPHTYVYCTDKPSSGLAASMTRLGRERAKACGWDYYELSTDHEPEQCAPDEVVSILLNLASD